MGEATRNKTILGPDCRISGELALDNDAVIMGQFKGTLRVSGMLELTDSSQVSGTVIVGTLRLAGHAEADVVAEEAVELLPSAELIGQLYTSRLNVNEGAVFQGDVCVGPKAIQAASEALNQDVVSYADHDDDTGVSHKSAASTSHNDIDDDDDHTGQVKTVPGSVNQILQRRRTKVLAPRGNGMSHST